LFFPETETNTQYPEITNCIIPYDTFEHYIKLINIRELDPILPEPKCWDEFPEVPPKPLNLDKINFEYPEKLQSAGIEGTVFLELLIDKEGKVVNVVKKNSIHPTLDKIAVENARKIKFSPNMQKGKPVAIWHSFPIKFKLK